MLAVTLTVCSEGKDGNGGNGSGGGSQPPNYNLSADQAKLAADHGNPEYLTISVNLNTGIREETWTYSGQLGKMYVFWDGEHAGKST